MIKLNLFKSLGRFIFAPVILVTIVACGGGGDAAPPTSTATTFPLTTAVANYVNEIRSYRFDMNGTGTSSGQTISFTGSGTASQSMNPSTFEGISAFKKNATITGSINIVGTSTQVPIAFTTTAYFDSNYSPLGSTIQNAYCVASSISPLPTTVRVGDNGNWYTSTCYTSSSKTTIDSTAFVSYSIEPESTSTALFKMISTSNGINTSLTHRITTSGSITRVSETGFINIDGVTMIYTGTYQ